ncbi:MAG: hypothetical protein ACK4K7_12900 [Allosphingosinicella sp.]|uniref:hypothetical protein n=1 Tax=Allosphingosinicella sp. TaxID=2823234 RepID=UPI0039582DDA
MEAKQHLLQMDAMELPRLHSAGWYREEALRAQRLADATHDPEAQRVLSAYARDCISLAANIKEEVDAPPPKRAAPAAG